MQTRAPFTPFQFHKGTIRTLEGLWGITYVGYFNSIKVRLERLKKDMKAIRHQHFNSIKVRLEHSHRYLILRFAGFQFHKGTIRTNQAKKDGRPYENFNSIKVRLEHFMRCA